MTLQLTQTWTATPADTFGSFHFKIHNLTPKTIDAVKFCYTSLGRIDHTANVTGGTVLRSFGSYVEVSPDNPIPANGVWELHLERLIYGANNRTQGVLSAWVETSHGEIIELEIGDLEPLDGAPLGDGKNWPKGEIDTPLGLIPWPAKTSISQWHDHPPKLYPANDAYGLAFANVAALHRRLFPSDPAPISVNKGVGGTPVVCEQDENLEEGGYTLSFDEDISLTYCDEDGLRHGLISLTQIAHAARADKRFKFPKLGDISDAPRFSWRGLMFDNVRSFFPVATNLRMLDIMAWLRMNRLHWHITDDEGWRIPSKSFQGLNGIGATRERGAAMPPQYSDGPEGKTGYYTEEDIAEVIAHAQSLGIEVMPEVEMPGHAASLLASITGLRDLDEPDAAYRSVQGFTNNALNPGIPYTYEVAETLLNEAIDLFPFDIVHIGADEVEHSAWSKSPMAQIFAKKHNLKTTHEMQAYFLRHIQKYLASKGRKIGAWDEAAEGGGISPDTALLFAWRSKERITELIEQGYDVIATPGQAYYLDMVESAGWDARGISWAGISTPEHSYNYEVANGLPEGPGRVLGVQAAIWTEYLTTEEAINTMAFPRLAAAAEAGWTPSDQKLWPRFCAVSRLVPQL